MYCCMSVQLRFGEVNDVRILGRRNPVVQMSIKKRAKQKLI